MVADLVLIGLEMLRQRAEHQAAVDGIIGIDGLDLRNERFLGNVLGQDKLHDLDADQLCAGGRALFVGQVGRVLAAADDRQLRADALFLQSRNASLELFVHRGGNFLTKQQFCHNSLSPSYLKNPALTVSKISSASLPYLSSIPRHLAFISSATARFWSVLVLMNTLRDAA